MEESEKIKVFNLIELEGGGGKKHHARGGRLNGWPQVGWGVLDQ